MAALPEEPAEAVTVKPDPDAGAPPPPPQSPANPAPVPAPASAAAAPLADGEAGAGAGAADSKPPAAPSAQPPAAAQLPTDRQTLLAVLQFLRRSNLRESEEILRREARLLNDEVAADLSPSAPGGQAAHGGEGQEGSLAAATPAPAEALLSSVTFGQAGAAAAPAAVTAPPAVPLAPPAKGEKAGGSLARLWATLSFGILAQ